eukprot:11185819-Heterocapsa_arctica.AAC.1
MIIESYNVIGWGSLKKYLEGGTDAHIILAQETHLLGDRAVEASSAARKLGWKVLQSTAIPGVGLGCSGGVMILARDWLGLSEPNFDPKIVPGTAIAAKVEFPDCPPFLAISAY